MSHINYFTKTFDQFNSFICFFLFFCSANACFGIVICVIHFNNESFSLSYTQIQTEVLEHYIDVYLSQMTNKEPDKTFFLRIFKIEFIVIISQMHRCKSLCLFSKAPFSSNPLILNINTILPGFHSHVH